VAEAPPRPASAPSRPPPDGGGPLIRLAAVTRVFREGETERVVLRGVDAEVRRGELVVLLGRSGSGKSTLLNLIGGIDLPTTGDVEVAGLSLARASERARTLFRRRHVGFVFQFFNLIPTLTVEENLRLPLELNGREGVPARQAVHALLDEVGLADRAPAFPERLSGGEQQRVAVARALIHDPDLVLADEPTGNLDLDTGRQVLELLDRMTRRAGKTMVMVTHAPEVVGLADRLLRIQDGRLVAESAPAP
jgi:putative ABC transport system ATP-binding protein